MLDSYVVSKTLDVHPSDIQQIAKQWHQSLPAGETGGRVRCGSRFWLAPTPDETSVDPLELYRVRGLLWVFGRPTRVELAFCIWSETVSQVTLRPTTLNWPVCTERYERQSVRVVEYVASSVTSKLQPAVDRPRWLTSRLTWGFTPLGSSANGQPSLDVSLDAGR